MKSSTIVSRVAPTARSIYKNKRSKRSFSAKYLTYPCPIVVTEHQAEVKNCPQCQQSVQAHFPSQVIATTQYGEYLKSQIAYLSVYQLILSGRLAEFHDFYGQPISEGMIPTVLENLSEAVEPSLEAVREQLVQAAVA
jgi:transposase